jgi:hypothetical protein
VKLWNRLLIILHLRRDWANEIDLAPPAFDSVPHVYDSLRSDGVILTCCAQCGGGPKHSIHSSGVGPWGQVHARSLEAEQRRADGK